MGGRKCLSGMYECNWFGKSNEVVGRERERRNLIIVVMGCSPCYDIHENI